tara:strand:- start:36 stop:218 length:183 start_codon:yes stop_codon:yes gene_type:complete
MMGRFKDVMVDSMNVHQMQEYLNKYESDYDVGYIKFLEQELEKAEETISILTKKLNKKES